MTDIYRFFCESDGLLKKTIYHTQFWISSDVFKLGIWSSKQPLLLPQRMLHQQSLKGFSDQIWDGLVQPARCSTLKYKTFHFLLPIGSALTMTEYWHMAGLDLEFGLCLIVSHPLKCFVPLQVSSQYFRVCITNLMGCTYCMETTSKHATTWCFGLLVLHFTEIQTLRTMWKKRCCVSVKTS